MPAIVITLAAAEAATEAAVEAGVALVLRLAGSLFGRLPGEIPATVIVASLLVRGRGAPPGTAGWRSVGSRPCPGPVDGRSLPRHTIPNVDERH